MVSLANLTRATGTHPYFLLSLTLLAKPPLGPSCLTLVMCEVSTHTLSLTVLISWRLAAKFKFILSASRDTVWVSIPSLALSTSAPWRLSIHCVFFNAELYPGHIFSILSFFFFCSDFSSSSRRSCWSEERWEDECVQTSRMKNGHK